ncbi:hypothetical protein OH77DRAFT_434055 [Trametes cingulata]|nr:hypothetical protein OH77DRAFT_434055 [Trametes cingulata]
MSMSTFYPFHLLLRLCSRHDAQPVHTSPLLSPSVLYLAFPALPCCTAPSSSLGLTSGSCCFAPGPCFFPFNLPSSSFPGPGLCSTFIRLTYCLLYFSSRQPTHHTHRTRIPAQTLL